MPLDKLPGFGPAPYTPPPVVVVPPAPDRAWLRKAAPWLAAVAVATAAFWFWPRTPTDPVGPTPPDAPASAVRSAASAMAAEHLETYAARLRTAAAAPDPGPARDEAATGWASDRAAAFAKWLGEYERSIAPGPGEPTPEQKQAYRLFLEDMAAGVSDAAAAAAAKGGAR